MVQVFAKRVYLQNMTEIRISRISLNTENTQLTTKSIFICHSSCRRRSSSTTGRQSIIILQHSLYVSL